MHADARQVPIPILKADDDLQVIWGWASVIEENGVPVVDLQGDLIDEDELVKAANAYMAECRKGGTMHMRGADGQVIETSGTVQSMVFTKSLQKAMGIDLNLVGWLVAQHIPDPEQWAVVKRGALPALSIGATAVRVPVEID